jgi:hypothetical protein
MADNVSVTRQFMNNDHDMISFGDCELLVRGYARMTTLTGSPHGENTPAGRRPPVPERHHG